MVHRSGSTHQYEELFANEESNSKAKDDLQIAESFKTSTSNSNSSSNIATNQSDENETKRSLRTSKRLNSINPDVMTPPKSWEISSSSSNSKTSTDTLMTFATNLTVKPKSIRNRRYTINDCVHPINEKSISVPFADQKKLKNSSSTTDELFTNTRAQISGGACSGNAKSFDDFNLKKDNFSCSVSLERLTGIVDTISTRALPNGGDKDDLTAAAASANKVFCLYCDRTFSSFKLYGKHVERVHQSKSGRRISARTTNNAPTINYPGCSYCNVGKVTSLESEELAQLVHHLCEQHGDKYFACEKCMIRFQTRELLQKHASALHGYNDAKLKKESQRKTPRNVQSMTNTSSSSTAAATSTITSAAAAAIVTPLTIQVDFDSNDMGGGDQSNSNLRNRLRRSTDLKAKSDRSTRRQLLSSEETFLSRLGIGLNRSPRSRKGAKNRRGCSSELFESTRLTRSNKNSKLSIPNNHDNITESLLSSSSSSSKQTNNKIEPIVPAFDEDFYESVNHNVKQNLSCHVDGKLDSGPMSPSPLSPVASVPTVRSILVKSPLVTESEIHEATTISAFTAFPTLLTAQQHGGESLTPGKMKKPITKNSWKWKWDCVKKYKYVNEGGKIVKKIKQSTCGMRDLSTLDMWTQLTMRMRHEVVTRQENEISGEDNIMAVGEAAREEKRKLIEQLNKILDTRIVPKINVEQSDQSIIKQEAIDEVRCNERNASNALSLYSSSTDSQRDPEFPALMNLIKRERTDNSQSTVILSGEWARPRCYICFGCGSLFSTVRTLEEHKASKHPYVHSTHYEIVGKELIDGNLFRNFYIPSLALQQHNEYHKKQFFNSICATGAEDSMDSITSCSMSLTKSDSFDMDSNSRNSKVSVSSVASVSDRSYAASADDENANSSSDRTLTITKTCSKCNRQCKGTLDLYRHMLDCSSDYAWILAKKRNNIKYRYFGTKRRRQQRSSSQSARKIPRPKKERRNSDTSASQKSKEPSTPRQRPSDAESIQRMLANLPAKRAVRQIFPNLTPKPINKNKKLLPNSLQNRKKILLKQKSKGNSRGFKVVSTSSTTINSVGTNLALRKRRNVETANSVVRRTRSSLNAATTTVNAKRNESSGRKSTTTATTTTSPSPSTSSSSSSSTHTTTSKNQPANNEMAKSKKLNNDLGSMFRRRTKAVVTKLTNTFRRGQKQRLLRTTTTTTHHSPNTSKNTNNTKLDKNKLKTKSKKTFLRTLSFRRSNRNANKMDKTADKIVKPNDGTNQSSSSSTAVAKSSSSSGSSSSSVSDSEKKSSKSSGDENKKSVENSTATIIAEKANVEKDTAEKEKKSVEACAKTSDTVAKVTPTPEMPRLRRKRSIKTIINEMRAKCQNQTNAATSPDSVLTDDISNEKQQTTAGSETKKPIEPIPSFMAKIEEVTSPVEIPKIASTPVDQPLTLTITPLDEPLNLCISPQKNRHAAHSAKENDEKTPSSSTLQPPEPHLDNISPRRRTRKLNDCIAMLTGKLQEKLGVPFIDQSSALLPILSPGSEKSQSKPITDEQNKEGEKSMAQDAEKTTPIEPVSQIKDTSIEPTIESVKKSIDSSEPIEKQDEAPEKNSTQESVAETSTKEPQKLEKNEVEKIDVAASPSPAEDSKKRRTRRVKETPQILAKDSNVIDTQLTTSTDEKQVKVPVEKPLEKTVESIATTKSTDTTSKPLSVSEEMAEIVQNSPEEDVNETKKNQQSKTKVSKRKLDSPKPDTPKPSGDDNNKSDSGKEAEIKSQIDITVDEKIEEMVDAALKTTAKSKKKPTKQKTVEEKTATVEPSKPEEKEEEEVLIETANVLRNEVKVNAIESEVIDIEDEIKTNIIPNEHRMVDLKQTKKQTPPPKKSTAKVKPTKSDELKEKMTSPQIDKVTAKVNRTTRSGKQPIDDVKMLETSQPPPEKKKSPTKAAKSATVSAAAKKKTPSKETKKSTETKEVVIESPSATETVLKEECVNEKLEKIQNEKSTKLAAKEPQIKQNKKSKSKSLSTGKVDEKLDENDKSLPEVIVDSQESKEESSELQLKQGEKVDIVKPDAKFESKSEPERTPEPTAMEPAVEKPKLTKKQSEKSIAKTDKNSKKKTKKVKSSEKNVKNNKLTAQPDTMNFDNSDDELLPWDPEKGFIQTADVPTVSENISEKPKTPTPTVFAIIDTPVDPDSSEKEAKPTVPKPKKKRKSELAQIIADQLLESFKEVDQSRVDELKKIQDLPLSQSEAELISTSLSTTPIPKRKSKKLFETIEPKKSEKSSLSSKSKSDVRKKSNAKDNDEKEVAALDSSSMEESSQQQSEQEIEQTVSKSKKEKKSSKKKSTKKDAKRKINNETNVSSASDSIKSESVASKIVNDLTDAAALNDDINKESLITSSTSNIHTNIVVDKVSEKTLFSESTTTAQQQSTEKCVPVAPSSTASDAMSSDSSEKSKTNSNSIFTEVLLSQKKERLNDIIGLADKEALSRVPSIKNVVFPQWQSGIDKPTLNVQVDKDKILLANESKLNFWGRASPTMSTSDKSGKEKSKMFGIVKNRAKDLFSRISKKKLKKSIKTSIRSSSSSSSSSSCSSNSSINAPKKPLLRPSILSCNNFIRETLTVKVPSSEAAQSPTVQPTQQQQQLQPQEEEEQQSKTAAMNDIFDSLRNEQPTSKLILPQKLETPRISNRTKKEKNKSKSADTNPKSPIESDMNIAKIAIALEKSNRKELHNQVSQNLNTAFVVDKTAPSTTAMAANTTAATVLTTATKAAKKSIATKAEKKSIASIVPTVEQQHSTTPSLLLPPLQNDDSQDTIISQIVSKIREKADRTDSDDELCLADVAKGLPKNSDHCGFSTASPLNDLSEAAVQSDISALVSNINKNLEESAKNERNEESAELNAKELCHDNDDDNNSDDENTNTELIDMDLEDNESVYTTFSQSTSITSGGGGGKKKRRKKSILSSSRKSKRNKERRLFASPTVSFFCDICNKSFRNQNGLNNHKATITHISKLSEQEFLNATKEKQNENKDTNDEQQQSGVAAKEEKTKLSATAKEDKPINSEKPVTAEIIVPPVKIVVPSETHENIQSSVIRSSPVKTNSTNCSPYVSPNHINPSGIEPISSPEQASRFNGTSKNNLTPPSTLNSRLTLSQEERLFYECCSMLKGSDRPTVGLNMPPELITKPVTPKCNEQNSQNIAHAAQSPRSHSSPRPGLPKLDINQFSDISSDSNPAYSCPQVPSSSKTHKVFSLDCSTPSKAAVGGRDKDVNIFGARQSNTENLDATSASGKVARSSSSSSYPHSSTIVRNYPDSYSDMGDSFPSSQDASESENYAQTILDRSNQFPETAAKHSHNTPQKGEGNHYMQASLPHENVDFRSFSNRSHSDSPLHSTSSQSSSLSRPRTKAALKGYENLKVSIPTSGLDLQHALDRSPNSNGCKLAALADIALGNDVPFDLIEPHASTANDKSSMKTIKSPQKSNVTSSKSPISKQSSGLFMVSSDSTKLHSIELKTKSFEATFHVSPRTRKRTQSIGKKTGYKDRKKKCRTTSKLKSSPKIVDTSKPKDVYDFEESHDSVEDEIIPLTHTRPHKSELRSSSIEPATSKVPSSETPKKQCDDQEDESSYSDRDDYYNFNSVSGSGTEDQENPIEEDENSDRETTQSSKSTSKPPNKQNMLGRIFGHAKEKNAKKNSEIAASTAAAKSVTTTASTTTTSKVESKSVVQKTFLRKDFDEIFDNLKNKSPARSSGRAKTPKVEEPKTEKKTADESIDDQLESLEQSQRSVAKSRKSREVANLEDELGMPFDEIKSIMGMGKGQRRCTTNRQNKLIETWSSDEYEEFHQTKDLIELIKEISRTEMKAQRSKARSKKQNTETKAAVTSATEKQEDTEVTAEQKPTKSTTESKKDKPKDSSRKVKIELKPSDNNGLNETEDDELVQKPKAKKTSSEKFQSEDESDFDEHWNKKAKRAKIRNRRRTIMSREDLVEKKSSKSGKSKEKLVKKSAQKTKNQHVNSEKKKPIKDTPDTSTSTQKSSSKSTTKEGKPMPRRKRIASEMLYYWSSSSDEEFGRIEADSENEDEHNNENQLEQHGWIVGDSHKKLVTLLAHAKHKKIEDCGVKESVHKRK